MREVKRSALVSQPPAKVFALIEDIESYPQFLPWCTHARVLERHGSIVVASLGVRQGAFTGAFTTRNTLTPDTRILMQLVEGPFRHLEGRWDLAPIEAHGCRVELAVSFEFKNRLSGMIMEPLFAQTLGSLVEAFVRRARERA